MLEPWAGRWKQLPFFERPGRYYYAIGITSLPAVPAAGACLEDSSDGLTEEEDEEANVIQEVPHSEEPKIIDPREAAVVAEVQQAGLVERLILGDAGHVLASDMPSHSSGLPDSAIGSAEKVIILRFGSAPKAGDSTEKFRQALLEGVEMGPCRTALQEAGHRCDLPCGALVFVSPQLFECTVRQLEGTHVRPYHVIVAESLEYLVDAILERMPFKKRPRVKSPRNELEILSQQSRGSDHTVGMALSSTAGCAASSSVMAVTETDSDSDGEYIVEVKRTFIHVRDLRVEDSRTNKTW